MGAFQLQQMQPHTPPAAAAHPAFRRSHNHTRLRQQLSSVVPRAQASEGSSEEALSRKQAMGIVYVQQQADVKDTIQFPCNVPLLPFTVEEVLLPGSVKTLHLFEARYLSLLDDVLAQPGSNKVFAHVVIEQQGDTFGDTAAAFIGALNVDGYVFVMASLVRVIEVKKTFIGALVRVQAEARVQVKQLTQTVPYFKGEVVPLCDEPMQDMQLVHDQVEQLSQTVRDLQNLTQRFKSKQSVSLAQAMYWCDRDALVPAATRAAVAAQQAWSSSLEQPPGVTATLADSSSIQQPDSCSSENSQEAPASSADAGLPSTSEAGQEGSSDTVPEEEGSLSLGEKAVRLSFAALQGIPEESAKDQLKLLQCCVKAMKTQDTSQRLTVVQGHMQNSLNTLAAKCALKSLNLG